MCALCGGWKLDEVLHLPATPLANELLDDDLATREQMFPLDLQLCAACGHVQLGAVVDPGRLFRRYLYVSGTSPVTRQHFDDYADTVVRALPWQPFVVEVGSNDGTLLKAFKARGARILGIDPAVNLAQTAAAAEGVPTLAEFFDVRKSVV